MFYFCSNIEIKKKEITYMSHIVRLNFSSVHNKSHNGLSPLAYVLNKSKWWTFQPPNHSLNTQSIISDQNDSKTKIIAAVVTVTVLAIASGVFVFILLYRR